MFFLLAKGSEFCDKRFRFTRNCFLVFFLTSWMILLAGSVCVALQQILHKAPESVEEKLFTRSIIYALNFVVFLFICTLPATKTTTTMICCLVKIAKFKAIPWLVERASSVEMASMLKIHRNTYISFKKPIFLESSFCVFGCTAFPL